MTEISLQKSWYASKVFFNKVFEIEKILQEKEVECYIPCETVLVERNGIKKKVRKPMISSLLFFLFFGEMCFGFAKPAEWSNPFIYQKNRT